MNRAETLERLAAHGIKPSVQRLAVMSYLATHRTHPTVEEIYEAVVKKIPTLSKATVYNTLKILVERGAALQLTINEHCTCYDGDTTPHAHFFCKRCGHVYDMPLHSEGLEHHTEIPEGFRVEDEALYFRGVCAACLKAEADSGLS